MNLIIDTDEMRIIPDGSKWKFEYRFRNTNIFFTNGNTYENPTSALVLCIVNMAIKQMNGLGIK